MCCSMEGREARANKGRRKVEKKGILLQYFSDAVTSAVIWDMLVRKHRSAIMKGEVFWSCLVLLRTSSMVLLPWGLSLIDATCPFSSLFTSAWKQLFSLSSFHYHYSLTALALWTLYPFPAGDGGWGVYGSTSASADGYHLQWWTQCEVRGAGVQCSDGLDQVQCHWATSLPGSGVLRLLTCFLEIVAVVWINIIILKLSCNSSCVKYPFFLSY